MNLSEQTTKKEKIMNYSNPRMEYEVSDYPSGRNRVVAKFSIEQAAKGERGVRVTGNPKGGMNAPKKLTYAVKARIVDGDDGRTYIAEFSMYGQISIIQSNMQYQQEFINDRDPRFAGMIEFFKGV
jgi:hypothetical protein